MAVSFGKSVLCAQVLVLGTRAESNLTSDDDGFEMCPGSSVGEHPPSDWAWSTAATPSPSCMTPRVQNLGKMCNDDPTSVVIINHGTPSCLKTDMSDCKLNMREVEQIDFDLRIKDCGNTWAAPLWLTPDTWSNDGGDAYNSGELDLVELCVPHEAVGTNFAGQIGNKKWAGVDPMRYIGHVTMWNQGGDITVQMCNDEDKDSQGSCYQHSGSAHRPDIYNSNGCKNGNCQFRMVSDIWNGNGGDEGFTFCSNRDNKNGPPFRVGNPSTDNCRSSIRNIRVKGPHFSGKCSALSANQAPVPAGPAPAPAPNGPAPAPSPSGSCAVGENVQCPGGGRCQGNQCCSDASACPSAENTFVGCPKPKGSDCTAGLVVV